MVAAGLGWWCADHARIGRVCMPVAHRSGSVSTVTPPGGVGTPPLSCVVSGLTPGAAYTVLVRAGNVAGVGPVWCWWAGDGEGCAGRAGDYGV